MFEYHKKANHDHKVTDKSTKPSHSIALPAESSESSPLSSSISTGGRPASLTVHPRNTPRLPEGLLDGYPGSPSVRILSTAPTTTESERGSEGFFGMRALRIFTMSPSWAMLLNTAEEIIHIKFHRARSGGNHAGLARSLHSVRYLARLKTPLTLVLFVTLIGPAAALDNEIILAQYPGATMMAPDRRAQMQMEFLGTYILFVTTLLTATSKNLLGPLMGISSVLWFIMRNDAAIKPTISWA